MKHVLTGHVYTFLNSVHVPTKPWYLGVAHQTAWGTFHICGGFTRVHTETKTFGVDRWIWKEGGFCRFAKIWRTNEEKTARRHRGEIKGGEEQRYYWRTGEWLTARSIRGITCMRLSQHHNVKGNHLNMTPSWGESDSSENTEYFDWHPTLLKNYVFNLFQLHNICHITQCLQYSITSMTLKYLSKALIIALWKRY